MNSVITLLRDIIREELGRNIQTPPAVDRMVDWRHLPGVEVSVVVDPVAGIWHVNITDEETGERLPTKSFRQESEANHYGKITAMGMYGRKMQLNAKPSRGPSWY